MYYPKENGRLRTEWFTDTPFLKKKIRRIFSILEESFAGFFDLDKF